MLSCIALSGWWSHGFHVSDVSEGDTLIRESGCHEHDPTVRHFTCRKTNMVLRNVVEWIESCTILAFLIMGPLIPLFRTNRDVCPGFRGQGGFPHLHAMNSSGSPLVQHLQIFLMESMAAEPLLWPITAWRWSWIVVEQNMVTVHISFHCVSPIFAEHA